jgi:hypothetical protein
MEEKGEKNKKQEEVKASTDYTDSGITQIREKRRRKRKGEEEKEAYGIWGGVPPRSEEAPSSTLMAARQLQLAARRFWKNDA